MSQNSVEDEWAMREQDALVERSLTLKNVLVVPLVILEGRPPTGLLRSIKFIDMRSDFEAGLLEFIDFLRRTF